ncbi:hypothetical protein [Clostridium oceanicum]|uniref:Uncharacterized protein n=1 Tax=Clostridium oceanicum TaxID=1543 RepID=A0ABP3USB6_9CLOT
MKTREYVEYLLKNYKEILKDIDQLKFEYESFKDITQDEFIESLNFSSRKNDEFNIKIQENKVQDKTSKIALVYSESLKRINKENKEEIYKMIKATELEITRLNYCINRLDQKLKAVIKELFLEKSTWNKTALKCSISEKTLSKYKNKGIDEIAKMFELSSLLI